MYITPKNIKIDVLMPIRDNDKKKRIIYVDLSNVEEIYHQEYINNLSLQWKAFEPGVKFIILPYTS